jgi:hypothetical protein
MQQPKNPPSDDPKIVNVKAVLHRLQQISVDHEADQPEPKLRGSVAPLDATPIVRPAQSAARVEFHQMRVLISAPIEPQHLPATKSTNEQVEVLDSSQDTARGRAFTVMVLATLGALIAAVWWLTRE